MNITIAERFFHVDEYSHILKCKNKLKYFYFLWTVKESYLKAIGTGLSKSRVSFCVKRDQSGKIIVVDNEQYFGPTIYKSIITKDRYYISSASFSEPVYDFSNDVDFLLKVMNCVYF